MPKELLVTDVHAMPVRSGRLSPEQVDASVGLMGLWRFPRSAPGHGKDSTSVPWEPAEPHDRNAASLAPLAGHPRPHPLRFAGSCRLVNFYERPTVASVTAK